MSYAGLPSSVTIDGISYRIIEDAEIKPASDRKAQDYQEDGEFDAAAQEIRVRPGMGPQYVRHIVAHECLHMMWEHAGLTAAGGAYEQAEEAVVTALAWRLISFLRANPEMVKWLTT